MAIILFPKSLNNSFSFLTLASSEDFISSSSDFVILLIIEFILKTSNKSVTDDCLFSKIYR